MAEKTTIARPYAQAVFGLAREQGNLKHWSEQLALVAAVVSDADMARLIDSPRVDRAQKVEAVIDVCGDRLDAAGSNLIRVLADNDRIELLPEVAALFEIERSAAEGTLQAQAIVARPLSDDQKAAIAAALTKRFGRDVSLSVETDETLLGGAIIRAGDVVIDGSAIARLDRLRGELMH